MKKEDFVQPYDKIDKPYGDNLTRSSSPSNSNNGEDLGNSPYSGQPTQDLWIDSFIKSRSYLPKRRGFYLEGRTGKIIATDFQSGDLHMNGDHGIWFGDDRLNSPFLIDPSGAMESTDFKQVSEWIAGENLIEGDWVFIDSYGTAWKASALHQLIVDRVIGVVISDGVSAGQTVRVSSTGLLTLPPIDERYTIFDPIPGTPFYLTDGSATISQTLTNIDYATYGAEWHAQTFTATKNQAVVVVNVGVKRTGTLVTYFNVELQETDGSGKPNGNVLASKRVDFTDLPASTTLISFPFATQPGVMQYGVKYALVFYTSGGFPSVTDKIDVAGFNPSIYAGGQMWHSSDSGSTWANPGAPGDAAFQIIEASGYMSNDPGTVSLKLGTAFTNTKFLMQLV